MGWGASFYLTAVGDTVHVAARLEQATKDYGAELVVSADAERLAGVDLSGFAAYELTVRNRAGHVAVRVVQHVDDLPLVTAASG
jgi:class 3 adenylate cyclase